MTDHKVETPTVSVVIVNFNAGDYLRTCLESLQQQTLSAIEIIVVDNASIDNSMTILDEFRSVRQIRNQENRGFAAAQNQGFALARGGFVVALNYDLELMPNYFEELRNALAETEWAGWATGKLLSMTSQRVRSDTLYAAGHVFAPDRFSFLRGCGEVDNGQYDQLETVFGATGAATMYRREMINDISLNGQFFDEKFFTWFEDVDVDWRANNAGWTCLYVPSAVAYHVGHVDERYEEPYKSWRAAYGIRNRWLLIGANETFEGLWKTRKSLVRYELSSLMFVSRNRLVKAYLKAFFGLLAHVPYLLTRRRLVLGFLGPSRPQAQNGTIG